MSKISLKHSGGNVVSLNSPTNAPGAADVAFKLPNADGSDGQALVTDGSGNLSFGSVAATRNLIINGAMQVAQRGTSSTTSSSGYPACDRWRVGAGGLDEAITIAQSALTSPDTPYSSGFRYATKITNGNQTSGLGGTDFISFAQRLEGQDINSCGWDFTSTSSKITISFWIKSSVAQTFYSRFRIVEASANKEYVFAVAATTSWQKITKTIPGASGLNPINDNEMGFFWDILLAYGTDYTGSMTVDQWNTVNTSAYVPDMASSWYTTNDATFEITGVQLEVGSSSTDFQFRSFAEELNLCTRYFQKLQPTTVSGQNDNPIAVMANFTTTHAYGRIPFFNGIMRTGPSLTTSGCSYFANTNSYTGLTFGVGGQSESSMEVNVTASSGNWTTGHAGWIRGGSFELNAEL